MISREFVLAGNAIFTVSNPSGTRYTYRVRHREANGQYGEAWFVSLLTGPDNESDYTYLGMLTEQGVVRLTGKSKLSDDSQPVRVLRWALERIWWRNGEVPAGYALHHEGRCGRCGRLLTVPESVDSGIGPECAKILEAA